MKWLYKIWMYLVAMFFLIIFGYPFIFVIFNAFKSNKEYIFNIWGPPSNFILDNFRKVATPVFLRYFRNSGFVALVAIAITILFASLAGYAFANLKFKLSTPLFFLFLMGMMIPVHTTLIPVYTLTRSLGVFDKSYGLIGPYVSFGLPIAIFILTGFFKEVPKSIQESAIIDGCGHFGIYWRIVMPLSAPAISTVAIYNFLTYWNEFIYALTLINSTSQKTLPLGVREFYGAETVNIPAVLTSILASSLPVMLFYFIAQERVIDGLSAGAVKG